MKTKRMKKMGKSVWHRVSPYLPQSLRKKISDVKDTYAPAKKPDSYDEMAEQPETFDAAPPPKPAPTATSTPVKAPDTPEPENTPATQVTQPGNPPENTPAVPLEPPAEKPFNIPASALVSTPLNDGAGPKTEAAEPEPVKTQDHTPAAPVAKRKPKPAPRPSKKRDRPRDDGMRDYPTTRPHLAHDYLAGLVRWLAASDYKVMSYNELADPLSFGQENDEFQNWIAQATSRNEKAVLLQYDVDARPDMTAALMKTHIECGVPGNAMIFRRKIFDWKLKREGIVEYDEEYNLDYDTFEKFQKIGGVIGYHCNAFDRAAGDTDQAMDIFHEDIELLRRNFDLKFFSMHGGHVTKDGKSNSTLPVGPLLDDLGLTWVHNGHSMYFHTNWADGSASNPNYRKESNDTLDFIQSTGIGERTRLLFHPQYYNDETNTRFDFPILQEQTWVLDTRNEVEAGGFSGLNFWTDRYDDAQASIAEFKTLYEQPADEQPVFINGMSRSGTTLLVSMFDAHPEGAMAYESYPRYLHVPSDGGVLTAEEYIYTYQTLMNYPDNVAFNLLSRPPLKNLMRFAAVTSWTGMTTRQTGELLRAYLVDHLRVANAGEALKIVAASARYKVRAEGARFWGSKCQGNFRDYFDVWPEARIIYIMRNGLDILASQKTKGSFNPEPTKLGKSWKDNYNNFVNFQKNNPQYKMALVGYEELVNDPDGTFPALCEQVEFDYHPQMIRQHEVETTLAKNPRGQLSADRVQQPIDNSSVGRWKSILSQEDIDAFLEGCGGPEMFEKYGLEWEL